MGLGSPSLLLAWRPTGAAVLAEGIEGLIQEPAVLLGAAAVVVVAVLIVLIMVLRGGSKKAEPSEFEEEQERWEPAPRGAMNQPARGYDPRDQMLPWEQGVARADAGRQQMSSSRGLGSRAGQSGWGQADQAPQWEPQAQPAPRGSQWVGTDEWVPPTPAMGHGSADPRAQGQMGPREQDGWGAGQAAAGGPNADQWGQAAAPMGRGQDQWGQGPSAPSSMGRVDDQWGQGAPMRGRGQDQWGGQASFGAGAGQAEAPGFDLRAGGEPAGQAEGQWGQGSWGQANAGWGGSEPADRWGQPASQAQPSWPVQSGGSRPSGQIGMAGVGNQSPVNLGPGGEWGERGFDGQMPGAAQPGSGWSDREPPVWSVEPRREQPAWEAPGWQSVESEPPTPRGGQRSQPLSSQPRWEQANSSSGAPSWESASAASEWGQPAPMANPTPSRPIEPAGARGMGQPVAPGGDWGNRDFDRPTAKPAPQPNAWEPREAPPWQSPAPQMAAPQAQVEASQERAGADLRPLGKVSPDSTAYAPAPEGGEGEADRTVVIRKDAGASAGRTVAVVVRQGKEPGRTYDVRKDHISIGRSRESDIFLEDLAVSRLHATIYRDEMGGYLLRDENSANGTSVNGQRVTECALQEGDEIQLGQTILAFVRR